jgi:20S proteasome alpha/beta subunit
VWIRPDYDTFPERDAAMTYIGGFRAQSGLVMAADGEESRLYNKKWVEKIYEVYTTEWQLGIGGAGFSELIEGFIAAVKDEIEETKPQNFLDLKKRIECVLRDFYRNDVRMYPAKLSCKQIAFLIFAQHWSSDDVIFWQTRATKLYEPKSGKAVIGIEGPLCESALKQLHRENMPMAEAVLLSVHLLGIAKNTVAGVSGKTQVLIAGRGRMEMEDAEYIAAIEERLRDYESEINKIFLALSDTSVDMRKMRSLLRDFSEHTAITHRQHIDRAMRSGKASWDLHQIGALYLKWPTWHAITVTNDGVEIEHDPDKLNPLSKGSHLKSLRVTAGKGKERTK